MNHYISGFHSNISQILLRRYHYRDDHSYLYFWVPGSLYAYFSSLPCRSTYKPHRWENYHWNRFICTHIIFLNRTTGWWSALSFTISGCDSKDTSVNASSKSFSLHNYLYLLYYNMILHYHVILAGQYHIINWYTLGTAASDSEKQIITIKLYSTVNSVPQNYFLNFFIYHLNMAA